MAKKQGDALEDLILALRDTHAEDVRRARFQIDKAIAAAGEEWVPANAIRDALLGAANDLVFRPANRRADA